MELNHFSVPHYRINRSSAKISELPEVAAIDPAALFIIAHNGRNYKVSGTTLMTVISNAIIALGSGSETLDPLTLPIGTATQQALNGKANLVHMHEISHVNGLVSYITDAINLAISGLSFAAVSHTHPIQSITGLQTVLDSKAIATDIPPILQSITNLTTSKADAITVAQIQTSISNLVTLINNKASQTDLTSLTNVVNDLITTVSGLSTSEHVHDIADITGLTAELAVYASSISALSTRLTAVEDKYVMSGAVQW
jgi:hypothetical protein